MSTYRSYLDIPYITANTNASNTNSILVDNEHCLDLYLPLTQSNDLNRPLPHLLIYLHGGLWMDRDKSDYKSLAIYYCKLFSLAVAVPNYRLTKDPTDIRPVVIQHPSHTEDVASALAWLSLPSTTSAYQYDSSRIIIIGHSCGAHMAGLLTLSPEKYFSSTSTFSVQTIVGIIGICGLYDLRLYSQETPEWTPYIQKVFGKDLTKWDCPTDYCPHHKLLPSWLLIDSRDDAWVNHMQLQRMSQHLRSIITSSTTTASSISYPTFDVEEFTVNGSHWGVIDKIGSKEDEITVLITSFLQKHIINYPGHVMSNSK